MDLLLVFFMSFDTLMACISCGARQIAIPTRSGATIAGIGTLCLALSFLLSHMLSTVLPPNLFRGISCGALLIIALLCLFDEAFRRMSERLAARCHPLRFHLRGLCFVLEVYAENTRADRDRSGILSVPEAAMLALPLSLDSLLTGLSITATPLKAVLLLCFSFVCGMSAASLGRALGARLRRTVGQSASVFSGASLLLIACLKCFL
ncbi:MAG: manganese efflux pump [Intestinibacillus sp.]